MVCCIQQQEDRALSVLHALGEFVAVASKAKHKELRVAVQSVALESLHACEQQVQLCIRFLLQALQTANSADSARDAVWMLCKIAYKSDAARGWILDLGGAVIIQALLVAHADDANLLHDGMWLVFTLDGLRGLDGLCRSCDSSRNHTAVRTAVAWRVFELVRGERVECGVQPRPEAANVLALLAETMSHESASNEAQWACISALDAMVKEDPRLGNIFMERGGATLMVSALRMAITVSGREGEDFRRACSYLIASLAECNSQAAEALRGAGALHLLGEKALCGQGLDVEAVMWALGVLGGLRAVLEAIGTHGSGRPHVVQGGIRALHECAWNAIGNHDELRYLPDALTLLLQLIGREGIQSDRLRENIKALGCVVTNLAVLVDPGAMSQMDLGIKALLDMLPAMLTPLANGDVRETEDSGSAVLHPTVAITVVALEALGRVALVAPKWREAFREHGALEDLRKWIRLGLQHRRLQKYLLWAAAAISGLPFVASEMQEHISSANLVSAALCTIIDVIDFEVDGEYALRGVDGCNESDMPAVLNLVLDAMRAHPGELEVQHRGCHCISLLVPAIPKVADTSLASTSVVVVLAAAHRFPRRYEVIRGVCRALRELCLLMSRSNGALHEALAASLKVQGAVETLKQVLHDFADAQVLDIEVLEDAVAALTLLQGVEAVLSRLTTDSLPGAQLRVAGLKALFEVLRADQRLLVSCHMTMAAEAAEKMAAEEPDGAGSPLCQVAALLTGLCGGAPRGGA